jgi:hypothetical protein
MKYTNKTFSVGYGSEDYRKNWGRIFKAHDLTPYQVSLMKHATSWNSGEFRLCRNYFSASPGSSDDKDWAILVDGGYAFIGNGKNMLGDLVLYHVSEKGIKYLEENG